MHANSRPHFVETIPCVRSEQMRYKTTRCSLICESFLLPTTFVPRLPRRPGKSCISLFHLGNTDSYHSGAIPQRRIYFQQDRKRKHGILGTSNHCPHSCASGCTSMLAVLQWKQDPDPPAQATSTTGARRISIRTIPTLGRWRALRGDHLGQ